MIFSAVEITEIVCSQPFLPRQIGPNCNLWCLYYPTLRGTKDSLFMLWLSNKRKLICAKYLFTTNKACGAE